MYFIVITCLFQSAMLVSVFGQEESLAQKVFDKHTELLQRPDIQTLFPEVLTVLKSPGIQPLLTAEILSLLADIPDTLKPIALGLGDDFFTLLEEDAAVKAFFRDVDVQALLMTPTAIEELIVLIREGEPDEVDEIPTEPTVETTKEFTLRIPGFC